MVDPSRSPADWGEEFRDRRPLHVAFAERLRGLLSALLEAEEIDPIQVTARGKDVASFVEKLTRKEGRYSNPLDDMTDLSGARVVVHYLSEVQRVGGLITREFDVDPDQS